MNRYFRVFLLVLLLVAGAGCDDLNISTTDTATNTTTNFDDSTTCVGRCGKFWVHALCQCDEFCSKMGNCCPDFGPLCMETGAIADVSTVAIDPVPNVCASSCGVGSYCDLGTCVVPTCTLPKPISLKYAIRISKLQPLSDKEGCDLDEDGVPNNSYGKNMKLTPNSRTKVQIAIIDGTWTMVWLPMEWTTTGASFDLAVSTGSGVDDSVTVGAAAVWDLSVLEGMCPKAPNGQAQVKDGKFKASVNDLPFALSFFDLILHTTLTQAWITGDVSWVQNSPSISNGRLCGIIWENDLIAAIQNLPDTRVPDAFDKETLMMLIPSLFKPDIDLDGDSIYDAISIAFEFETSPVTVVGYE